MFDGGGDMKKTHLLIDLDGTLVDGDRPLMRLDFMKRMNAVWNEKGDAIQTAKAFYYMRKAVESPPNGETNEIRMARAFSSVFKMDEKRAKHYLEKSIKKVFPYLEPYFSPIPGASEFIEWGKKHYTLILATNPIWIPEAVEMRARWGGIDMGVFHSFTHAARMHSCKPRKEYYQEILEQENLCPEECILIGNDLKKDLPANRIGIEVYIVSQKQKSKVEYYEAISVEKGHAAAWKGNYLGLKKLLENLHLK